MDGAFALKLALSFVVGGGAVALFTAIAERQGSRLGGLLLSFPIKVVVSLALIGATEGAAFAASVADAVPAGIAINVVFLTACALLAQRWRTRAAIAGALVLFALAGTALTLWLPLRGALAMALWAAAAIAGVALLDRMPGARKNDAPMRGRGSFGARGMLGRALGAGTAVAGAVLLARVAGPFVGGLASVFPSGFLTTMIILLNRYGAGFAGATARVMVAGSAAPALFGLVVATTAPAWGMAGALAAGLAAAGATSLAVGWGLRRFDARAATAL